MVIFISDYGLAKFEALVQQIRAQFMSDSREVNTREWQAIQGDMPQARTRELEDVTLEWQMPEREGVLASEVKPNLPWAEDHFMERVSGEPHNPPPSHEWWPFGENSNAQHLKSGGDNHGQFSHTYPERFWPIFANVGKLTREGRQTFVPRQGIRFEYGDYAALIELLSDRPDTRQAFLPIWFPEDLRAAWLGERVPCTLGYHFMIRNNRLKIVYYIRSCDFRRHFRDDVYMAIRLAQFTRDQINQNRMMWAGGHEEGMGEPLKLGKFIMHISSLHIFQDEFEMVKAEYEARRNQAIMGGLA